MADTPWLSLILPAYNEVGRIRHTIQQTRTYLDRRRIAHEIIVAADGDDGTREAVAEMARSIPVCASWEACSEAARDAASVSVCSRQPDTSLALPTPTSRRPSRKSTNCCRGFAMATTSSLARAPGRVAHRESATAVSSTRLSCLRACHAPLLGLWHIHDTQCGFKFFRAVVRDLFRRQRIDGYMFDVEILHLAEQSGYHIKEVGVRWRDDGDSRLKLVAGNWRNMLDILARPLRQDRPLSDCQVWSSTCSATLGRFGDRSAA